jgi:hypothetical protein
MIELSQDERQNEGLPRIGGVIVELFLITQCIQCRGIFRGIDLCSHPQVKHYNLLNTPNRHLLSAIQRFEQEGPLVVTLGLP